MNRLYFFHPNWLITFVFWEKIRDIEAATHIIYWFSSIYQLMRENWAEQTKEEKKKLITMGIETLSDWKGIKLYHRKWNSSHITKITSNQHILKGNLCKYHSPTHELAMDIDHTWITEYSSFWSIFLVLWILFGQKTKTLK